MLTDDEKRIAVLNSAAVSVENKDLGVQQVLITKKLAAVVRRFMLKENVSMELAALAMDTLTGTLCIAVYDDAEEDGRVERVKSVTIQ